MYDETKRKTLANCKLSEFTAQANKYRRFVNEYYKKLNVPELAKKFVEKYKDKDAEGHTEVSREFISDVLTAMLEEYPAETVKAISIMGFMTYEEAENLDPTEAFWIALECIMSQKVLDFFISVESLGGRTTDSILPVLIFLKQAFSEKNTLDSESNTSQENETND